MVSSHYTNTLSVHDNLITQLLQLCQMENFERMQEWLPVQAATPASAQVVE